MRLRSLVLCACLIVLPLTAAAQPPPSGDFTPVDETLPGEQIPAVPLIATAYGFIWVVLLGYVWTIGRRLQKVETELAQLEARGK